MLGADRVHARRRGGELRLVRLDDKSRARAEAMAHALITALAQQVGAPRGQVDEAIADVSARFDQGPGERRVLEGLIKLADDASTWASSAGELDPVEVRRVVFGIASALRRTGHFARDAALSRAAEVIGQPPEALEAALYGDLRSAQRLVAAPPMTARTLVEQWERAQAQAVLLRAVRIEVHVACASAASYRALFHRLKFLRLLHEVHRLREDEHWPNGTRTGGHRIVVEGPFSMFESVTKYGLELAMVLPVLESADAFHLSAEVRWGAQRTPLTFKLEGGAAPMARSNAPPPLPDHVEAVLARFRALGSAWSVRPSPDVLELPGIGLCVPDLLFEHPTGARVFLEILGFWSREAVFRRVELVERGLPHKIVFAVSKRLRVREDLLDDALPAALYVYKGTMSARVLLEKLEGLRAESKA
ncbi:MAG: DUF790 family protein [Deltaproteobacteria bacterium]|nr:DUF790 family protein [Deltaproteobacteria bacterium]